MIPFATVACLLETKTGLQLECSLHSLYAIGFTVRMPSAWACYAEDEMAGVTLVFHHLTKDEQCCLHPQDWQCTKERDESDALLLRFETTAPAFRRLAKAYMQTYQQYVLLKEQTDDSLLSQTLVGYPAASEGIYARDWASQRTQLLQSLKPDSMWSECMRTVPQLAVALSEPALWSRYLQQPMAAFSAWYWHSRGMSDHPLAERSFNCVYIGNQFCSLLQPSFDMYTALMDKALREQVKPVIVLSTAKESRFDEMCQLVDALAAWCDQRSLCPDLVLNDWGLLALVKQRWPQCFHIELGILLQKRRKDVRMPYVSSFGDRAPLLRENALHADFYLNFLREMGIERASMEACGYEQTPPPMRCSLHLPFYQTNTAGHCTLYASCVQGDRGRQTPVDACPGYCVNRVFLYPTALQAVGRYNTLFGLDARSLTDCAYLCFLVSPQTDRLVIELL